MMEVLTMQRSSIRRGIALGLAGMMVLAACTSGSATPAPGATDASAGKSFWVGFTSVGLSSAGFLAALAAMETDLGYDIETPILAQSELVTEGVANGRFAFGSGANNSVLLAIQNGANLKVIADRIKNEWTLYARSETIQECADLQGQRLAQHSEGAVSTAMVRNYIKTKCPGTVPEEIFIEGSPNRVAALIADQIDASPVELSDSVTVEVEAGDRFSLLSSFSADLPDLKTTSIYVNGDFAAQNPQAVRDLVKSLLTVYRRINSEPGYLKSIAEEFVGDAINPDTIDAAVEKYVTLGMFPNDGGVTQANLDYTATFFGPEGTGTVDKVFTLAEWADLSYLNTVLDELGP
jgi:ABC-type nitrate/sulfonate/bicarbonate transport system substrate-binding protein